MSYNFSACKFLFIGAGNMTEAIVKGYIKEQESANITVADISQERLDFMKSQYHVNVCNDNEKGVQSANFIVLAVKPQVFREIWKELSEIIPIHATIISIMAGVSALEIEGGEKRKVVRVMPNPPSLISKGMAGAASNRYVDKDGINAALDLMSCCGSVIEVNEEDLHAVTAISGSGPAYYFYFLEAMIETGMKLGLSERNAELLAKETAIGACQMALETSDMPSILREKVTSKGGTTEQAINSFIDNKFKKIINEAVTKAYEKSKQLSQG